MANDSSQLWWLALLVCLVVSFFVGAYYFSTEKIVEKPVIIKETEIQVVEIPKEVVVEKEVPLNFEQSYLAPAWKEVVNEFEDSDDYLECKHDEYDQEQIEVKRFSDFGITVDSADWETYTVFGEARLKYLDKDVEEKCHKDVSFEVFFEEDESPEVKADFD